MELAFIKEGSKWVAEFEVKKDFNLHIEREGNGGLFINQRTDGGEYDLVDDFDHQGAQSVIDYGAKALVYPKFIKVVSEVEPTFASVTSSGEITEIKVQSKSIVITSNGTTDVTPDAGFAYLRKVSVKTQVPTEGGKDPFFVLQPMRNGDFVLYDLANKVAYGDTEDVFKDGFFIEKVMQKTKGNYTILVSPISLKTRDFNVSMVAGGKTYVVSTDRSYDGATFTLNYPMQADYDKWESDTITLLKDYTSFRIPVK